MSDARISAQDADELAACFTADARGLFGYACVLTRGDRALAEDLVQAAFEAAGRAWPVLRCLADEQRRAWLRTTLANTAVSGYRREAAFRDRLPRIESRYRVITADPVEHALHVLVEDGDLERIAPHAERGQQRVDGGARGVEDAMTEGLAPSRQAGVGLDPHQQHVDARPGMTMQHRRGGVDHEGQVQHEGLDPGDLHGFVVV